jgi:hypothetical protein
MTYMRQFTNMRARGHGDILPSGSGVEARGGSQVGPGEGVRSQGSGLVLEVCSSTDLGKDKTYYMYSDIT